MNLADLITEGRNPHSTDLDRLSTIEIVRLMNSEDAGVPAAVAAVEQQIATAIDVIAEQLRGGGRLIYLGAGTSGRLGVLDAAECPPTFNSPPWQVVGLIAGGKAALTRAIEGAEDLEEQGALDLQQIGCSADDVVVGIATSGRTPYVIGGLKYAQSVGSRRIGLSCNAPSQLEPYCEIEIAPLVGPEVVTGSTRLKAGTATKLVLNTLTTGAMVRLGKTFGNLMVDLQATNQKLADRSERIVAELTNLSRDEAGRLLATCHGDVKTAIVAHHRQISVDEAQEQLCRSQGHLRDALSSALAAGSRHVFASGPSLVLGVDGGGTRTRAWLAEADSESTDPLGVGEAETSNAHAVGTTAALANIERAILRAFNAAGVPRQPVASACLAVAGAGSAKRKQPLEDWAQRQRIADHLLVTHDAMPILAAGTPDEVGIALISGTGSLAFGRNADGETARAGGWGHKLGDEGSGYKIALAGLQAIVKGGDGTGPPTGLTPIVMEHLGLSTLDDLLSFIAAETTDVRTLARLAPLVIAESDRSDAVATRIVEDAGAELARLVQTVAAQLFASTQRFKLMMAGGVLAHSATVRTHLLDTLHTQNPHLLGTELITTPARGTILLARRLLRRKLP